MLNVNSFIHFMIAIVCIFYNVYNFNLMLTLYSLIRKAEFNFVQNN